MTCQLIICFLSTAACCGRMVNTLTLRECHILCCVTFSVVCVYSLVGSVVILLRIVWSGDIEALVTVVELINFGYVIYNVKCMSVILKHKTYSIGIDDCYIVMLLFRYWYLSDGDGIISVYTFLSGWFLLQFSLCLIDVLWSAFCWLRWFKTECWSIQMTTIRCEMLKCISQFALNEFRIL